MIATVATSAAGTRKERIRIPMVERIRPVGKKRR